MSINLDAMKTDTDNILSDWGEACVLRRNTPTVDSTGRTTDSWATVGTTETGDIQPVSGQTVMSEAGYEHKSTNEIYLDFDTNAQAGDRIRPAGWSSGDDEYRVNYVKKFEEHAVAFCTKVEGHKA